MAADQDLVNLPLIGLKDPVEQRQALRINEGSVFWDRNGVRAQLLEQRVDFYLLIWLVRHTIISSEGVY